MAQHLFEQVNEDIKNAMKAREKMVLEALRGVKKEFLEAKTAKGGDGTLSDEQAIKIIQKMVKQRKESAEIYQAQQRPELAEQELAEAEAISRYLPKQLTDKELTEKIEEIIASVGATSLADMGKVMGIATKQLAGKTDGKTISQKVKELLT